jgi:hypothetical protein
VAAGIAAIAGLVWLALPDGPEGPPTRLRAVLEHAQVDDSVRLSDYIAELKRTRPERGIDRPADGAPARTGTGSDEEGATGGGFSTAGQAVTSSQGEQYRPPPHPSTNPHCGLVDSCPAADARHLLAAPAIGTQTTDPVHFMLDVLAAARTVKPVPADWHQTGLAARFTHNSTGELNAVASFPPIGERVIFDVEAQGYPKEPLTLKWSLLDARHGGSVGGSRYFRRVGMLLTPSSLDARVSEDLWVPLPRRHGLFKVRLELFDPGGARLALLDTPTFG